MNDLNKPVYFKNLDGLRAIAAFAVIFFHISIWFKYPVGPNYDILKFAFSFGGSGGNLGVTFFFILSGFLITYLMFAEQAKNKSLNVFFFYIRRILRIWPLYYLTLFVGFLIYPFIVRLCGIVPFEDASVLWYSLFAANFDNIYNGNPIVDILGVQWSVAVEEQFYLLWPVLFYLFGKKRIFPFLMISIIVFSEIFFINNMHLQNSEYHLLSCFRFLAFGGLLACICYLKTGWIELFFRNIGKSATFSIYCICLILILFQKELVATFNFYKYINHILPFLFFGFVIIEQNFSLKSFMKIGKSSLLTWLGMISYGLYLTHMIAIYIVKSVFSENSDYIIWKILLSVFLTVLISHLSYTYFELFFLSLKNKFSIIRQNKKSVSDSK